MAWANIFYKSNQMGFALMSNQLSGIRLFPTILYKWFRTVMDKIVNNVR